MAINGYRGGDGNGGGGGGGRSRNGDPDVAISWLNRETFVPVGMAVSVCLAVAGGAVWLNDKLGALTYEVKTINTNIDAVNDRLTRNEIEAKAAWTRRDQWYFRQLMASSNPELRVPDLFPEDKPTTGGAR